MSNNKTLLYSKEIESRFQTYLGKKTNQDKPPKIYRFRCVIAPDVLHVCLEYSQGSYLLMNNATTGTLLLAGNSAFHVDQTNSTGTPLGVTQWSGLYNRYRIRASRIATALQSTTTAMRLSVTPNTSSTLPSSVDNAMQNQYTEYRIIPTSLVAPNTDSSMETSKIYGLEGGIEQQTNFSAAFGADPASLWYWRIRAQSYDGITLNTAYFVIHVAFDVELYQRVEL